MNFKNFKIAFSFTTEVEFAIAHHLSKGNKGRTHTILKGRAALTRSPASPPPRLVLDANWDPAETPAKVMLPHSQAPRLLPFLSQAPEPFLEPLGCTSLTKSIEFHHQSPQLPLHPLLAPGHLSGTGSAADPTTTIFLTAGSWAPL